MHVTFTDEELAFRDEVRSFFDTAVAEDVQEKQRLGIPLERDDHVQFQKALFNKGWAGFNCPWNMVAQAGARFKSTLFSPN